MMVHHWRIKNFALHLHIIQMLMQLKEVIMKKNKQVKFCFSISKVLLVSLSLAIASCTKYAEKTSSTTTVGGTNNTAPTPLPPLATGGGTSSGGSSSGTTGGGTNNVNIPQAYVQGFSFTDFSGYCINVNDSNNLLNNGYYSAVYAGFNLFKYKVSTTTYITTSYFLRPYSYYSYVVFKSPVSATGETLLYNDLTATVAGTAQIRFISLDPLTTSVPITFKLTNYLDNFSVPNRTYLDNRTDTSQNYFRSITPGFSNVSFIYRDSALLSFSQNFEAGRKYTVFAGALSYLASSKGTMPVNYYQVARHN